MRRGVVIEPAASGSWRWAALASTLVAAVLGLCTLGVTSSAEPAATREALSAQRAAAKTEEARASKTERRRVSTSNVQNTVGASASPATPRERKSEALLAAFTRANSLEQKALLISPLVETGDKSAIGPLSELVTHSTPNVARAALDALGQIGGAQALDFLARHLSEASESELMPTAEALATLGGAQAHAVLIRAAQSPRTRLREAALAALVTLDTPAVRELMLERLSGLESHEALAYFSDCVEPRSIPLLERLARTIDAGWRPTVIEALVAQGPSAYAALGRLASADDDTSNAVLAAAKDVLGVRRVLRAASLARLRAGAITSGPVFDYLAADLSDEARAGLAAAARENGTSQSAVAALAWRGDSASAGALADLARDSEAEVAARAQCALFSAPDSRSLPSLLRATSSELRAHAATALLSIDAPEGERELDALRRSENPEHRRTAATLLTRFGPAHVERTLEQMAADPDPSVAEGSLQALAQLGAEKTLAALAANPDLPSSTRTHAAEALKHATLGRWGKKLPR